MIHLGTRMHHVCVCLQHWQQQTTHHLQHDTANNQSSTAVWPQCMACFLLHLLRALVETLQPDVSCLEAHKPEQNESSQSRWNHWMDASPRSGYLGSQILPSEAIFLGRWNSLYGFILIGGKEVKCKLPDVSSSSCEQAGPNGG